MPVSSSAQLVLLPWLLRWDPPADRTTFAAGLHAGSCLGIAWVLRHDLRALDRRTAGLLAASSVPAAVAGALAADRVETRLGRPPQVATLLAGAGVLLWLADRRVPTSSPPDPVIIRGSSDDTLGASRGNHRMITAPGRRRPAGQVTGRQAALAALAQVTALAPGVSRSGAALTALRAAGAERAAAQRFSLLMSLPITAGAAALTLARADPAARRALGPSLVAGAATATVAGAGAAVLQQRRPGGSATAPALYRLGLAVAVARRLRTDRKQVL